jgi:hypothetical protein
VWTHQLLDQVWRTLPSSILACTACSYVRRNDAATVSSRVHAHLHGTVNGVRLTRLRSIAGCGPAVVAAASEDGWTSDAVAPSHAESAPYDMLLVAVRCAPAVALHTNFVCIVYFDNICNHCCALCPSSASQAASVSCTADVVCTHTHN